MFIVPYCTALWYDFRNMDILSRKGVTEMPSSTRDLRFYDLSHPTGAQCPIVAYFPDIEIKGGTNHETITCIFLG